MKKIFKISKISNLFLKKKVVHPYLSIDGLNLGIEAFDVTFKNAEFFHSSNGFKVKYQLDQKDCEFFLFLDDKKGAICEQIFLNPIQDDGRWIEYNKSSNRFESDNSTPKWNSDNLSCKFPYTTLDEKLKENRKVSIFDCNYNFTPCTRDEFNLYISRAIRDFNNLSYEAMEKHRKMITENDNQKVGTNLTESNCNLADQGAIAGNNHQ